MLHICWLSLYRVINKVAKSGLNTGIAISNSEQNIAHIISDMVVVAHITELIFSEAQ